MSSAELLQQPRFETTYEDSSEMALSTAVAFAVARAKNVDPIELADEVILGPHLEAIDDLFAQSGPSDEWRFEFRVSGERVSVAEDGTITVLSV